MKKMLFAILIVEILMTPLISVPCVTSHFHLLRKFETLQLHIVLPVFDYQPEITVDKVCQVKSYPYYLRAPPVC